MCVFALCVDILWVMLSSNEAKYQRLGTTNPLHDTDSFSVRVLYKDKSHSLNDLNGQTTVGTFKGLIENVTDCPAQRQRLICAGKQLKPDEKTLSFFKITDGITIHLFPLPEVMPQAQPNTESTASAIPNSFSIEHTPFSNHTPAHLDPYIERTSLEVRWWSTLLLFLSAFSVFNYSSTLYSTGKDLSLPRIKDSYQHLSYSYFLNSFFSFSGHTTTTRRARRGSV